MARSAANCVRRYLNLISQQPRRGSPATVLADLQRKIENTENRIASVSDSLRRLQLRQQLIDLQAELGRIEAERGDFEQIEEEFVESVAGWAATNGVSAEALHEAGVSLRVLRRAGMP